MKRRELLIGAGAAGAASLSGCFGIGGDDDESSGENESSSNESGPETESGGLDPNDTGSGDGGNATGNETGNGEGNASVEPDENATEIDRNQYDHQNVSAAQERPLDDIAIEGSNEKRHGGGIAVEATVTNVSESTIDYVDLYVVLYDNNEQDMRTELIPFTDLEPGESNTDSVVFDLEGLSGEPAGIRFEPDVYDVQ